MIRSSACPLRRADPLPASTGEHGERRSYTTTWDIIVSSNIWLYLTGSGSNVAVGRHLHAIAPRESIVPGHVEFVGAKGKVDNQPIYAEFARDSSFVRGFHWLMENGQKAREAAGDDSKYLFVVRGRSGCKLISEYVFLEQSKMLAQKSEHLKGLNILPSMFRPTKLLKDAIENQGRIAVGVARGQHSENVSVKHYQFKTPTQLIHHLSAADYQKRFETLIILESPDLQKHYAHSDERLEARTEHLMRTGMGTFCKNGGRKHTGESVCQSMDCLDCPHAAFIADPIALADIQCWAISLRKHQADFERERPERWVSPWLTWLMFTEYVEESVTRGPLLEMWDQGTAIRKQWEADPDFTPPVPW